MFHGREWFTIGATLRQACIIFLRTRTICRGVLVVGIYFKLVFMILSGGVLA